MPKDKLTTTLNEISEFIKYLDASEEMPVREEDNILFSIGGVGTILGGEDAATEF